MGQISLIYKVLKQINKKIMTIFFKQTKTWIGNSQEKKQTYEKSCLSHIKEMYVNNNQRIVSRLIELTKSKKNDHLWYRKDMG